MKKRIGILLIIAVIFSCLERRTDNQIERFRNYVGQENYQATDQFLKSMETRLEETFHTENLGQSIKIYLEKTVEGSTGISFHEEDCNALRIYELSGMEMKFTRGEFDTVYFIDGSLRMEYGDGWSEEILTNEGNSEEQIIEQAYEKGYKKLIHWGKLLGGLEYIAGADTLILQYVKMKKNVGHLNPKTLAKYILSSGVDFSKNYFHRLVILLELYYREIKEYGC